MENPLFAAVSLGDADGNVKLSHDRYHVYVNGDFVGNKVLIAQNEQVADVSSYLKQNGFHEFSAEVEGDHYLIDMQNSDESEAAKKQLNAYLNIR